MRPAQIYDEPPAIPFMCLRCRAHGAVRDWFVDTGAEAEWEGNIYFCKDCLADIVRITPDHMTVESHREIVAQYIKELDEYAQLRQELAIIHSVWFEMTGNSLEIFFDNLQKVNQYGLGLSTTVSEPTTDESDVGGNSPESESDNNISNESEPGSITDIIFS